MFIDPPTNLFVDPPIEEDSEVVLSQLKFFKLNPSIHSEQIPFSDSSL